MSEVDHVGFTGTRIGLSSTQRHSLRTVLAELKNDGAIWFHHGDCVGADEEAHQVAKALGYKTHAHPPDVMAYAAVTLDADITEEPAPYMVRNQAIVDVCDILVACPKQESDHTMTTRSGTWTTVRKAIRRGLPFVICYSDGVIQYA